MDFSSKSGGIWVLMQTLSKRIKATIKCFIPTSLIIYQGTPAGNKIALTFDDGPYDGGTDAVLDVLQTMQQKATFFVLGRIAEEKPNLILEVVQQGCEIGNHSYSHADLSQLPLRSLPSEIDQADEVIRTITGVSPRFFRPPYGQLSPGLLFYLWSRRRPPVLWGFTLGGDGSIIDRPADLILDDVRKAIIRPGDIILMHDTNRNMVKCLPKVINFLLEKGFELVTLSELLTSKVVLKFTLVVSLISESY
jgi:peptidoglycan/xylan/chitin deacetylase (PgdA/CDA1 family)